MPNQPCSSPEPLLDVQVLEERSAPIVVGRGGHQRAPFGDELGQTRQGHAWPVLCDQPGDAHPATATALLAGHVHLLEPDRHYTRRSSASLTMLADLGQHGDRPDDDPPALSPLRNGYELRLPLLYR